jgi:anti-sigma B factor antagonist
MPSVRDRVTFTSRARRSLRGTTMLEDFQITRARHERGVHIVVAGELDIMTAAELRDHYGCEDAEGAGTILIDLAEVTFIDSSGLYALLEAHERFGERLVIIIGPPCAHVIDITDLRRRLPIIEG